MLKDILSHYFANMLYYVTVNLIELFDYLFCCRRRRRL